MGYQRVTRRLSEGYQRVIRELSVGYQRVIRLWNALPKSIRNLKTSNLEEFKEVLDLFLCKVPDEPKCDGLNPGATNTMTGRQSNSIIHQVARRTEAWMESNQELDPITGLFSNLL